MLNGPFNIVKENQNKISNFYSTFMDQFAYVVGIISTFFNIPQIVEIWLHKNAEGVSLLSWVGFAFGSLFWFLYAKHQNDKALIFTFGLTLFFQFIIIIGTVLYN